MQVKTKLNALWLSVVTAGLLIMSGEAVANTDWTKPAEGVISSLTDGFTLISGGIIGLALIIYALVGAARGDINWTRIGYIVLAGLIVVGASEFVGAVFKL